MERTSRTKPLSPEIKGYIIALYEANKGIKEIAEIIGVNVSKKNLIFKLFDNKLIAFGQFTSGILSHYG